MFDLSSREPWSRKRTILEATIPSGGAVAAFVMMMVALGNIW